jgi:hypothetical protein
MGRLWGFLKRTVYRYWGVLRHIPAERWCRIVAVGVAVVEAGVLLSSSNVPPTDMGEVFGEIHWYGEG